MATGAAPVSWGAVPAVVSGFARSKLAAPLFKKMICALASLMAIFLITTVSPFQTEARSRTSRMFFASIKVSWAKESTPTTFTLSIPRLRLGKLRSKLSEISSLKLTFALRFLLAASLTALTILPLNKNGSTKSRAMMAPRLMPVILAIFFKCIGKEWYKNNQ